MRLTFLCVRVVASLGLGVAGWVVAGGCGGQPAERKMLPLYEKEDVAELPMEPAWRTFANENYIGVVLARMGNPTGADFVSRPSLIATRNRTRGTTELLAGGFVDVARPGGTKYRQPYVVVWEQAGGGWRLLDVRVDAGTEAPAPPPERLAGPASRPATAPAAPATPAAPAAPAAPASP